ncbi:ABC transporter permease [Ruania alkalisoli]|uniref:ABC transporter permease n=1 Tax=Ruania alkalisoli TaxID=2779775 RepID=A0A7M1SRZ5_9MICO|nr:ABC transporter permease [Ruania alkalisoli]QOR70339.1 ABC transporter permease [Ruania alkalisoli]
MTQTDRTDTAERPDPPESSESVATGGAAQAQSQFRRAWTRFRRNKLALASFVVLVALIILAVIAPLIAPYGFEEPDYEHTLAGPGTAGHLLGTDLLGRDLLSRLIYSLRTSFLVGFGAELAALIVAVVIGLIAGYRGGRAEQFLMAITDVMFAFPTYLFAVLMVAVLGRSVGAVILAIAIASWVNMARLTRAQTMTLMQRDFVEAARAMGAPGVTIAVRYVLPNAVGPLLVAVSFGIPAAITAEAGLALLGLGVQPPTPSLGGMIQDGISYVTSYPNMLVWPAVMLAVVLLAFTWLGDGIRDAFDTTGTRR